MGDLVIQGCLLSFVCVAIWLLLQASNARWQSSQDIKVLEILGKAGKDLSPTMILKAGDGRVSKYGLRKRLKRLAESKMLTCRFETQRERSDRMMSGDEGVLGDWYFRLSREAEKSLWRE